MPFSLGASSLAKLKGVRADLVTVVGRAIQLTDQDFTVNEGVRSAEAERAHVANGTSRTMNSKHLIQSDGFGHAVDLVPWIDGKAVWDWDGCYAIAAAMAHAAAVQGLRLRWGGVWDRALGDIQPVTAAGMKAAHLDYVARFQAANPGRHALCDGPHFEIAG